MGALRVFRLGPGCAPTMQKVGGSRDELVFAVFMEPSIIYAAALLPRPPSPRTREEFHDFLRVLFCGNLADANMLHLDASREAACHSL